MGEDLELSEREQSLKTLGHVSYLLHAIVALGAVVPGAQPGVGLLIIAFIMDLIKQDEAAGTWQESHFRWRIRSVLIAGALYLLTAPLWILLIVPGWLAYAGISVWFLYRIVRGWVNLADNRPMILPTP